LNTNPPLDVTIEAIRDIPDRPADRSRVIGTLLMEEGRLSAKDVDRIQRLASERGMRFGDAAVQLQLLTPDEVLVALARQFNNPVLPLGGSGGVADEVIAAHNPESEQVEPLRALRSQLMLRWFPLASRKILAIVSPERGEGRSWLAANLATTFAQIGVRTLLIDADMRHPRQHQLFNLGDAAGLCELLTGRAGRQITQRLHPQLRLFVLPAGLRPPNPQELLSRPVFDVVIDRFAEKFDLLLLDTPASMQCADAQIIARHAGSALIVARQNRTGHSRLKASMESLTQIGVNVVGSVITDH
jgi:chain length determinant protein tyrosine kinase EpsG